MDNLRFIYWEDEGMLIGYLEEYPDYMTQGVSLDELKDNLRDIFGELTGGHIPSVRRAAVLEVS
ncbi:MAG: type II toxin-antitoxin system HicB family antitoxin [Candidatus Hydrogenedentes bacterium]|nr:type II toxin-antitoxin system HicB family antitoxin [Candidatus Hydrogenedentota bacterium]